MSERHSKRIVVWVQPFADRENLVLQWHDPITGKRKSRSAETGDPDQAEGKRSDLEYELNHGLYREPNRVPWEEFREVFEKEYAGALRPNTQRNFKNTLDLFEELCKPARMDVIGARLVSGFAAAMRTHPARGRPGMMASSIAVRLQHLHTILAWAVEQKYLTEVPAFPRIDVPKKDPQPVPPETFERLLDKATGDQMMQAYLLTGWLAGLRLEEAYVLEWEETEKVPWVDLGRDRIILPAEFVKGKRDQWLPLDQDLRQALEALPRAGRRVFHFRTRNGRPLSSCGLSQRIRMLAKRAGVRLTMRSLRRGFGCAYAGKVPAQVLQKLMRHANIKTTMSYYANVDEAVEAAVFSRPRNTSRNSQAGRSRAVDGSHDATAV